MWWAFMGNRGGPNRARIAVTLREQPMNANQLAQKLEMDYKTVRHHINVLLRNHLVIEAGEGYGAMYFISPELELDYEEFLKIWNKLQLQD